MLNFLFRRLTADPDRGAPLFAAITAEARKPHWFVEGKVPDTLDGRFAVLATVAALVVVRLEQAGDAGESLSVALAERFVEVMESEHRELGIGDPTLGRKVRKLVGSLSWRVDLWRRITKGEPRWVEAVDYSIYKGAVASAALTHSAGALRKLWARLERCEINNLAEGKLE